MESGPYFEIFRLLRGMRMALTGIHLEFLQHRVAERTFGQHALDRNFQHAPGMTRMQLAKVGGVNAARICGVTMIKLGIRLVARHAQLINVDHDDKIAAIDVRSEFRLVLAAQPVSKSCGKPPEYLVP